MLDKIRQWYDQQQAKKLASPAHEAARSDVKSLRELLRRDRSLCNLRHGSFQRTPLHFAAESGASECVRLLLEHGASVNVPDGLHSWTPLHSAVMADAVDCVALLLRHGAEVNASDNRGETPLFYAKSLAALNQLVDAGADLGVYSTRGQYPFQHCAAYIRSPEVLRFWLEQGVPVNHIPDFGWPALQAVCAGDKREIDYVKGIEMLGMLIEHGADVNLQGSEGHTPLIESCYNWHTPFVECLLAAGADPNIQDVAGNTALHAAVFREEERAVELLLNYMADVNLADDQRKTAFDICKNDAIRTLLEPYHEPRT